MIDDYEVFLLEYPIWHLGLPNIIMTQLELFGFKGKIIYPFIIHEGTGIGNSVNQIKKSAPEAIVKEPLVLSGKEAREDDSHEKIKRWILNIVETKESKSSYIKRKLFLLLSY